MKNKIILSNMKHIIKVMNFYLGYIFYFLITVNERSNYMQALQRGYDCTKSHDDSYIIYGSVRKYHFDKSKPPTRHYATFEQYKKMYYPNNN